MIAVVCLAALAAAAACERSASEAPGANQPPAASGQPSPASPPRDAVPAEDRSPRIIFLGDSLTAGLGLDIERSFPSVIGERLKQAGYNYSVVNAGVSGDTSAGGLRRLEWSLGEGDPKVLVVALGGNDGLRGLPPQQLESNLAAIIEAAQRRGLTVILAGMEAPPNFGADYTTAFRETYTKLAAKYQVRLVPFLLQGVAGDPALNQSDGIHPNERGARVVADTVWSVLEPALNEERRAR
jgi:acyl-CoA thioesterase I